MPRKIIKNNFFYLIIIIIFIIFLHYINVLKPIENLSAKTLKYPLAWLYSATNNIKQINISVENIVLKNKIVELENQVINLQKILDQKEMLDSQIEFLKQKNINSIPAKVIGKNINQNQNLLLLNKGSRDGLASGMAVVTENALVVGKLQTVMPETSHLLLLVDSNSEISAANLGGNSLVGIAKGKIDLSLELDFVPKEKKLNINDIIITSGVEEKVPAGLLIGEVSGIFQDERELFGRASIWQPADIKNITIVNVILP